MTIVMNEHRLPSNAEERILKSRQERDTAETVRVQSALKVLQQRYRSERLKLISADIEQKLREYRVVNRSAPTVQRSFIECTRNRTTSLAFAGGSGLILHRWPAYAPTPTANFRA